MATFIFLLQYATLGLLSFFLFLFFRRRVGVSTKNFPRSPPRLPIIGNLHQLSTFPHVSLRSLSQKYGDLMLLHFGSKPTLIVSSAEMAMAVMKTHDLTFCSRPQWKIVKRLFNNGKDVVFAPYGEYWRNMRSMCVVELLSKKRVDSFHKVRAEEVNLMISNIKHMVLSSPVAINMRQLFVSLSTDVICRVTLGRKFKDNADGADNDFDAKKVVNEISTLVGMFSIGEFVPCLAWIDKVCGVTSRVNKVTKVIDDFMEKVLGEHTDDNRDCASKDFIDILLDVQRSGDKPIDTESIKGLLLDMILAGTDTSSNVLEWMMSEVLKSPRVMEKLQKEVVETSKGKSVLTEDDLKSMVYLKATLKETLRLHPIPLISPREAMQDVEINGYHIEAGTMVFVNAWAIARDPRYWKEPDAFCPERFMDSSMKDKENEFNMIPFGAGRRGCPGELFGITIMELAMANLLLHFKWTLQDGVESENFDMRESPGMAANRLTPLLVVATPRISVPLTKSSQDCRP